MAKLYQYISTVAETFKAILNILARKLLPILTPCIPYAHKSSGGYLSKLLYGSFKQQNSCKFINIYFFLSFNKSK